MTVSDYSAGAVGFVVLACATSCSTPISISSRWRIRCFRDRHAGCTCDRGDCHGCTGCWWARVVSPFVRRLVVFPCWWASVRGESVGPTQPKPIGCIPPSVTIATRGMGCVGGAGLLELSACAFRETRQRRRKTATRPAQRRQSRSVGSNPRMASWMDSSGCAPR